MEKYSTSTEAALIPSVIHIATSVDAPLISEMTRGPTNLQNRSMRRILALRLRRAASRSWVMTTTWRHSKSLWQIYITEVSFLTQSRSTDTKFITLDSFSTQAKATATAKSPPSIPFNAIISGWAPFRLSTRTKSTAQLAATAILCPTILILTTDSRSPWSIQDPTLGERTIAAPFLHIAYTDMGRRVLGKMDARNRTEPNSKRREFHVERKWDM